MILRCELKSELEEKIKNAFGCEIKYSVPFDVNSDGMFSEGFLIITEKTVVSVVNDDIYSVFPTDRIEKAEAKELVGAGRLEITVDGVCHVAAKYTAITCLSFRTLSVLYKK